MDISTSEIISSLTIIAVVVTSRVLSHFEHKKTESNIADIHLHINGELQKK